MRRLALLAALAALAVPAAAAAFTNTEPDAAEQWYLDADQAWSFWPTMPSLAPIKVAIIDSGIDGSHPDLVGRVVAAKSFVGGSPYHDEQGHGTFVAGEIAANPTNAIGMAGLAFNARLIVAKVVAADGEVSLPAEVAGIRWAVDQGARVVNLSLGGVRDPLNPSLDTYSPLERAAVEYAYSKGAVVVAAVGNGTQSPSTPWRFAAYPAALPHVIGVAAVRRGGSVPGYSNRDAVYVDVAAPGDDIFSSIPSNLVADDSGCTDPYSDCGPVELRNAIGTSFAAPQVSAAAALLLGTNPSLTPDQVGYIIERSADDSSVLSGCGACAAGRDALTGWGALNVASALTRLASLQPLPRPDRFEPNDDAGVWARTLPASRHSVDASMDYWDDNLDVYRLRLFPGQRLFARLTPAADAKIRLQLWAPGTEHVDALDVRSIRLADSHQVGRQVRLSVRVRTRGVYDLSAKVVARTPEPVQYHLALSRRSP